MMDVVRAIIKGMVQGFQDSVVGIFKVYSICNELDVKDEQKLKNQQQSSPSSTLAKRRAERMKSNPNASKKASPPKLFHRLVLCSLWNGGIFWLSLLVFNGAVLPGLEFLTQTMFGDSSTYSSVWSYTGPVLSRTFSAFWVLPLFVLSKVVNGFWFQDIADVAYRRTRGRPQLLQSISGIIADILYSLIMQGLFLIQGMLAKLLPVQGFGEVVYLLHMCLLYSLYAFEYKWFNMSWQVHRRVSIIECNWPYFVGFGLPLALLTSLPPSFFVSGCVFSMLFPLFIISANEAKPVELTIEFPLRLFSPVIYMSNVIFQQTVGKSSQQQQQSEPGSAVGTPKKVTLRDDRDR